MVRKGEEQQTQSNKRQENNLLSKVQWTYRYKWFFGKIVPRIDSLPLGTGLLRHYIDHSDSPHMTPEWFIDIQCRYLYDVDTNRGK